MRRNTVGLGPCRGAALGVLVVSLIVPLFAAGERPSDKDVKQLLERVDHERDRFEDQLDGKLKRSILRGPGGEVNVERYLDDLQENVDRLKDRFASQYAASAEVTTVLRQGSDIQRFMATQAPGLDGMSEWTRLAASLGDLAAAYGTAFPIPDAQQARRWNDAEVKKAADEAAKSADRFKKELGNALKMDKTIAKPTLDAAVGQVDDLKKAAQRLASTIDDGRPASGEARAMLQQGAAIRGAAAGRSLSSAAEAAWREVEGHLSTVAQAFGLPAQLP
jgi:hypothetical protein